MVYVMQYTLHIYSVQYTVRMYNVQYTVMILASYIILLISS